MNKIEQTSAIQDDRSVFDAVKHISSPDKHPLQTTLTPRSSRQMGKSSIMEPKPADSIILPERQTQQATKKPSIDDYICICQLGRGSYGEVVLVKQKANDQEYAIKIIDKRFMAKEKKQYQVFIEREMLFYLKHPGTVHLYCTFQTSEKLYFVMEYLEGGDFSEFIKLNQSISFFRHPIENLTLPDIQFYIAEIVTILEFLHSKGIAHRDVKPENILITNRRHLKMIDFGTASVYDEKRIQKDISDRIKDIRARYKPDDHPKEELFGREDDKKQRATFVGTAEYVSPELLDEDICQGPADLWALGCIIFKLFTGKTPFYDNSEYLVFNNIKSAKFQMDDTIPHDAAALIKALLQRDPSKRLGAGPPGSANDYNALKNHKFFQGIDFETIWTTEAPFFKSFKLERDDTFLDPDLQMGKAKEEKPKKKSSRLIFYGLVQLKTGWFLYKPVDLVLYEGRKTMNLVFYDPETEKNQGKIRLADNVQVYNPKEGVMNIEIDRKVMYTFKEIEHPANKWLEVIDKSRHEKKKTLQK